MLLPDRLTAPFFNPIEKIKFIEPREVQLHNGQLVYCVNTGEQDLLRLEFVFKHNTWSADNPLLSLATNNLLNEGTSKYSSEEIAEKIDYYGAFLQTDFAQDFSSITLYTLSKHLSKVLPVFMEVLNDAIFPEEEVSIFVQNRKEYLNINLEKNDFVARRKFNKAIHGDSIYGFESTLEHYDALTRAELLSYYQSTYRKENCTLILAGKVTDDVLKELSDSLYWRTHTQSFGASSVQISTTPNKRIYVEKEQALQSAIRIGMPTISRQHTDYSSLQILNTVLGGYFGSRLMKNIREEKGYTYGIGSRVVSMFHASHFFIASEVGAEVCQNALDEIYKEVKLLQAEQITVEELDLVKNYMLGSILGSLENAFSHADKFKSLHLYNLDYSYYSNHIKNIKSITQERLQEVAQKYLSVDDFYEIVVGRK